MQYEKSIHSPHSQTVPSKYLAFHLYKFRFNGIKVTAHIYYSKMPLRWGARKGNAYDEDVGFVIRDSDEEHEVINPYFEFVTQLLELRDHFRLTDREWKTNIVNFVRDEIESTRVEDAYGVEDKFYIENILREIRDIGLDLKNYIQFSDFFGPGYFLNRFEEQLEYYYPMCVKETTPSWKQVWDTLNDAVLQESKSNGQHFSPIPYSVNGSQLDEIFREACVPPDMLRFAREAKAIAERCGDVPLAADVIREANRFLEF